MTGPSAMDPGLSMSLFKSPDYAQEVRRAVNVRHFTSSGPVVLRYGLHLQTGVAMAGQTWGHALAKGAFQASGQHLHHQASQSACRAAFAAHNWQPGQWQLCSKLWPQAAKLDTTGEYSMYPRSFHSPQTCSSCKTSFSCCSSPPTRDWPEAIYSSCSHQWYALCSLTNV